MTTTAPAATSAPAPEFDREALRDYHHPDVYGSFLGNTLKHEMTIIREDGVHRHIRFAEPGTGFWAYEIITWPGYLTIVGDFADGFVFKRTTDMLDFFGQNVIPGHINADYWAEKLTRGGRDQAKEYSEETFRALVTKYADELANEADFGRTDRKAFFLAIRDEVFADVYGNDLAHSAVHNFTFIDSAGEKHQFYDTYEWEFTGYSRDYLLGCHAILHAAQTFRAHKLAEATAAANTGAPDA
jgi:hypothetical protein